MIILELLITIAGITAFILVLAGVLLRPWWAGVLRRCRAEADVERRTEELARATEAAREEAEAEVMGWVEEPAVDAEPESNAETRESAGTDDTPVELRLGCRESEDAE